MCSLLILYDSAFIQIFRSSTHINLTKGVLAKDVKPLETIICLRQAKSIYTDDGSCVANSGKQALLENHTFKGWLLTSYL